LTIRNR